MAISSPLIDLLRSVQGEGARRLVAEHLESVAVNDDHAQQKRVLRELVEKFVALERQVDALLRNTLPGPVANELRLLGRYASRAFECSILFADVVGYTRVARRLCKGDLIQALDAIFSGFDDLVERGGGTKIKTIGDAYMAVFGAPVALEDHSIRAVGTALEMLGFLSASDQGCGQSLAVRIGIHSGTVVAGVVGRDRMQFDVFGEDVNIASRFESSGVAGAVNVSEATYLETRAAFLFEHRGRIALKNMDEMDAYLVRGLR